MKYEHIKEDFNYARLAQHLADYNMRKQLLAERERVQQDDEDKAPEREEDEDAVISPLLQSGIPSGDPVYGAVDSLNKDMSTVSIEFKKNLITLAKAHDAILNLYQSHLYEDDWDDNRIRKFDSLLDIYNEAFAFIKANVQDIEWNYPRNKNKFFDIYNNIIKADNYTFNRVQARHQNYKRYRANRKSIILQLANIITVKGHSGKEYMRLIEYFNDKCAGVPLYDNKDANGKVTVNKRSVLRVWLKPHMLEVQDEVADYTSNDEHYDIEDLYNAFAIYVKCREMAFKIFNMITSNSKYNGWAKWKDAFLSYCNGDMNDALLRKLYNAANAEDSFEDVDDYQLTMDDIAWNKKAIYESWWDDSLLDYYKENKDRFSKDKILLINMVPNNANVCQVVTDGVSVFANVTFYPGDIVEICPTKEISKSSLYSKDMRDIVFETIPNQQWVIPFGYCQYYDTPTNGLEANCSFLRDSIKQVIVIKAITKIPKYAKLVLQHIR